MSFKDFIKNEFPSFNGEVNFKEDVLIKDKNQSEFTSSLQIYLNKIITKERIKTGKENLKAWETQLAKIHKVWGVPPEVIIAIWGIETNFGEKLGTYRVVDALATLAFGAEGEKRKALFKSELSALVEIKNKKGIKIESLFGSWAGAFGHMQFMPTTFLKFSYPFEHKKPPNIWKKNNPLDSFASAAHYLNAMGWVRDGFILRKISKPSEMDYIEAGLSLGSQNGLIAPLGHSGPHFEFDMNASAIFHYNRSELYVFGVWILSSALITAPKKILWPKNRERIGASEVRVMQKQLTLLGYNTFGIDGKFGFNSKKALIDFQKDIKQTPDGHPDRSIFKRLLSQPSP